MKKRKIRKSNIVWEQLKKMKLQMFMLLVISIISALLELLEPYIDKIVINNGLVLKNKNIFISFLILGLIINLASKGISFLNTALFNRYSNVIIRNIKADIFRKLTNMPIYMFDNHQNGYIYSRIEEVNSLSELFSPVVFKIILSSITMVGALIYLFRFNKSIFLLTLLSIPIIYWVCKGTARRVSDLSERINESAANLTGTMQEYVEGAAEIKQLNRENITVRNVDKQLTNIVNNNVKRSNHVAGGTMQASFVCAIVQVGITYIVGCNIIKNIMTIGDYVSVIRYVSYVFSPVILFSTYSISVQSALVAIKRIGIFFESTCEQMKEKRHMNKINNIKLKGVEFSYVKGKKVLKDINFEITEKEKIQIYGKNGSGKTTLIKLIIGLLKADQGAILFNDIPIEEISNEDLRKRIGVLSQNSFIFTGSVIENIISCEEDAILWNKIKNNEVFQGVDWNNGTIIENGKNLSSGQKQKIVLARVMVRNPDVIIIDEGITNLDAESQYLIQKALDTVFKEKICIIISHTGDVKEHVDRKICLS